MAKHRRPLIVLVTDAANGVWRGWRVVTYADRRRRDAEKKRAAIQHSDENRIRDAYWEMASAEVRYCSRSLRRTIMREMWR